MPALGRRVRSGSQAASPLSLAPQHPYPAHPLPRSKKKPKTCSSLPLEGLPDGVPLLLTESPDMLAAQLAAAFYGVCVGGGGRGASMAWPLRRAHACAALKGREANGGNPM